MNQKDKKNTQETKEEKIIPLLEERLSFEHKKEKIGEVIIRKEIATQMIEVPVRREQLIIEQVSPKHQQLAEVDLSYGEISGIDFINKEISEVTSSDKGFIINGKFTSVKIASLLLNAIAQEENHGCQQINVTIVVENEHQQQKYQEWFGECSHK
jgi:hypothetical protein